MTSPACVVAVAAVGFFHVAAGAQTVIALDSRATYLHTSSNDPAPAAVALDLGALGAAPGDMLRLRTLGDWDCGGPCVDDETNAIAVFSNGSTLLPSSDAHRVPGAIDTGVDFESADTYHGSQPTDIPEDLWVTRDALEIVEVRIRVPAGATHVFIGTHDSLFYDNVDPDADFGLEVTVICAGDFNLDGELNFFDIQGFLGAFADEESLGDFNNDGVHNFFDVQTFLAAFAAGCP